MTRKPTPARRTAALLTILAGVLALALAGSVTAHDRGDDSHRFDDDDPAGTIASFDAETRVLAIDLTRGDTVRGIVTRLTWIECGDDEGFSDFDRRRANRSGGDHDWDHHDDCPTSSLTEGAVVDDAFLGLRDGRAFFWKVDLED